jgi:PhnB protein
MAAHVKPIPDGYEGATPYLCCKEAVAALDFYRDAFGAVELMRKSGPGGKVGHAEIRLGRAIVMLADEFPEMDFRSPRSIGGTPVNLYLYVEDVDAFARRAVAAGATLRRPVETQFYGDRSCTLEDPFGHVWIVATHVEDVPPEELDRRAAALYGEKTGG